MILLRFRRLSLALALGFCALSPQMGPHLAQAQTPLAKAPLPRKLEVRGLIRDDKGQPVAGAEVVVRSNLTVESKPPTPSRFKSDAAGRFVAQVEVPPRPESISEADFETTLLEVWRASVLIHAPGFALASPSLRAGDNEISLQRGLSTSGTVRDEAGKPVAAARVRVRYIRSNNEGDPLNPFGGYINLEQGIGASGIAGIETLTDAAGNWTIADLPPESHVYLALDDARFLNQSVEVSIAAAGEPAPAPTELVARPGASVTGRVLFPDGKPVAGARIAANVAGVQSSSTEGRTASDGTFSLSGFPAGKATIQVSPPSGEYAPGGIAGLPLAVSSVVRAPDITLSPGLSLSGTVLDAGSKKPVAGARVIASGPFGSASSTPSDVEGHYTVRVVAGQNRFYVATYPTDYLRDWSSSQIVKPIAAGSTVAPDFSLRRGVTLSGTAFDDAGQPAKGASISSGGGYFGGASTVVNAKGEWTLHGVDAHAPKPGDTPDTRRDTVTLQTSGDWDIVGDGKVPASGTAPIALVLRRIKRQNVTARVVTPEGEPVAGAKVSISILFDPERGARRFQTSMTNARGEITLRGLRPEESAEITPEKAGYSVVKKGAITRLDIDTKNSAARAVDAVMSALDGWVTGRVVDENGAPVAGALVTPLLPADLRDALPTLQTDADGKFRLEKLRAGKVAIGAAQGRNFGQIESETGKEIEIKMPGAASQPDASDVERAFALMAQWLDDDGPKPSYQSTDLASRLAFVDRDRTQKMLAQLGGKNYGDSLAEVAIPLVRRDPQKNAAWAREQISSIADNSRRESALLELATAIAATDPRGAQQIYDSIAPAALTDLKKAPQRNGNSYRTATLAGLAGQLKSPDAPVWRDATSASVKRMSRDDQMFRIGSFAQLIAQGDADGALQFLSGFEPALRVRGLEDVIPVVTKRDLPAAQKMLEEMEKLVAQPDLPVEADRNDAMYRPTPTHSLDVARLSILKQLFENGDAPAAFALAQKLSNDGYGFQELQVEAAARLPRDQALTALRDKFASAGAGGSGEAGGRARVASLVAPLDAVGGEELFRAAQEKLKGRGGIESEELYRESPAEFAFYRAATNPAQSRLLLENAWQRAMETRRARPKPAAPANGYDEFEVTSVIRLNRVAWAMPCSTKSRSSTFAVTAMSARATA